MVVGVSPAPGTALIAAPVAAVIIPTCDRKCRWSIAVGSSWPRPFSARFELAKYQAISRNANIPYICWQAGFPGLLGPLRPVSYFVPILCFSRGLVLFLLKNPLIGHATNDGTGYGSGTGEEDTHKQ